VAPKSRQSGESGAGSFCQNDPVNKFDPLGLASLEAVADVLDSRLRQAVTRFGKDPVARRTPGLLKALEIFRAPYKGGGGVLADITATYGNRKYMMTRSHGIIDIQHWFSGVCAALRRRISAIDYARERENPSGDFQESDVEDSVSDYLGAEFGGRLAERLRTRKKIGLTELRGLIFAEFASYRPVITTADEGCVLRYLAVGNETNPTKLTIGEWIYRGWKSPRGNEKHPFYSYTGGNSLVRKGAQKDGMWHAKPFSIFDRHGSNKTEDWTLRKTETKGAAVHHIDISDLIDAALRAKR